MKKLNFLLVDDEALVREGLRGLMEKEDFVNHVTEAANKKQFEEILCSQSIDVILLDFRMPDANGLELFHTVQKQPNAPKVIVLTALEGHELMINLLKTGVNSIVYKLDGYRELLRAIKGVIDSGSYFSEKILNVIRENAHQLGGVPPVQLSFHERELLKAIAQGFTTKQIASILKMPESTTETYRIRLIKKVQVANTAGLLAYAYRNGIL